MRTLIVLLIVFLASMTNTYGQYIKKQGLLYEAGGQIYKYGEMESVFNQDPYALDLYEKSHKRKKNARVFGFVTLGVIGGSGLALITGDRSNCELCTNDIVAILGLYVVVPITGIVALSIRIAASSAGEKAIRTINALNAQDLGIQDDEWKIDLKINAGGVGMVMTF